MADQRRSSHEWECFTCGGCAKPVRRRRLPNSRPGRCLCCSFLDAVRDVRMREALRRVLEPAGGPVAAPQANWRFVHQADGAGNAGRSLP